MTDERKAEVVNGVSYILPLSEGPIIFVKRIGAFGVGLSVRWSSIGLGVDILKAGIMIAIGPLFFWVAHIDKQLERYAALKARHTQAGDGDNV